jgi:hypothetical protein
MLPAHGWAVWLDANAGIALVLQNGSAPSESLSEHFGGLGAGSCACDSSSAFIRWFGVGAANVVG